MAIDLITEHIRMKLQQPELRRIYHNLELMPSNFQIRGMHTLIRDHTTSKADFVFYADRLLRLVSIFALYPEWFYKVATSRSRTCTRSSQPQQLKTDSVFHWSAPDDDQAPHWYGITLNIAPGIRTHHPLVLPAQSAAPPGKCAL